MWEHGKERVVSYLPLSHIAGTMHDIYFCINKVSLLSSIMLTHQSEPSVMLSDQSEPSITLSN